MSSVTAILLCPSVVSQGGKTCLWQRNGPQGVRRLGGIKYELRPACRMVFDALQGLSHVQDAGLEVNILPPEPEQLAASQSHHEEGQERRIQLMPLEGGEELGRHLAKGEGAPFLARLPWGLDKAAHIPGHKLALLGSRQSIREEDTMGTDCLGIQSLLHLLVVVVLQMFWP